MSSRSAHAGGGVFGWIVLLTVPYAIFVPVIVLPARILALIRPFWLVVPPLIVRPSRSGRRPGRRASGCWSRPGPGICRSRSAAKRTIDDDPAAGGIDDQVAIDGQVAQVTADEDLTAGVELEIAIDRQ